MRRWRPRHRGGDEAIATYLIIFGAAVRPDGRPSGSLARRIDGALAFSRGCEAPVFVVTGGVGRHGPAEALVMRERLAAAGVSPGDILVEDQARDTLQSVRLCDAILRARGDVERVVPCTSRYHLPRCALLLRLLGYRVRVPPMPSDRGHLPFGKRLVFALKEVVATPYDAALLLLHRRPGSP